MRLPRRKPKHNLPEEKKSGEEEIQAMIKHNDTFAITDIQTKRTATE